jgi:hypothetical protein
MTLLTVELPDETLKQLERVAQEQQQSVPDVVRQLVLREMSGLPRLSDEVLWLLARSKFPSADQTLLATLNDKAQREGLSEIETFERDELLESYNRSILRRARAAEVLLERGYDLSNPAILA